VNDRQIVDNILLDLAEASLQVDAIVNRPKQRNPFPPFTTSTLQQSASSFLGFSPDKTMRLAQELFEKGKISYHRTDSINISPEAAEQAKDYIVKNFGPEYAPEKVSLAKGKASKMKVQAAHEAIRPAIHQGKFETPLEMESSGLSAQHVKLYTLIWSRFIASQMSAAKTVVTSVSLKPVKSGLHHSYIFTASKTTIQFDGFLKVWENKLKDDDKEDGDEVKSLPELKKGEELEALRWLAEEKKTKPPKHYSEASLIKALEANGVGRPSTYAAILATLNTRKYTKREKSQLIPTELGLDVSDLLVSKMPALFDVAFTAAMESELDEIEAGRIHWQDMMQNFWERFNRWLEESKEPPADVEKVARALKLLDHVQNWNPSEKRGRRIVGDQPFVESIREQVAEGEKPISEKQLAALVTTAIRYKDQIPDAESAISELGFSEELEKDAAAPSIEDAKRRLAILDAVALNERQIKFVNSLRSQTGIGKKLTAKQMQILESIILENKGAIENFDQIKEELGLCENTGDGNDPVGPAIMQMLSQVVKWKEPVKRGKRIFDDAEFYSSVARQFALRGTLSPKQLWSMKKLCVKYADQISDCNSKAEELGLNQKK
jgi:DNA topoisomerase-1